jgi:hypothetical protein
MRQLVVAGVAAAALALPATAAADFPGQRAWQDPAVTEPYMTAAGLALDRLYPTDERRCDSGIALFLADDLGTADDGVPATAHGESCRIVMGSVWLPSAYGGQPAHKRLLCTVFAHERAHAVLNRAHVGDPSDLMYFGALTVELPECAAAFPDPADGFVKPGFGPLPPSAPPDAAGGDAAERVCIPAWAARSTRSIRRHYLRAHPITARRLYRRWARERPGRAARARSLGPECRVGAGATARRGSH